MRRNEQRRRMRFLGVCALLFVALAFYSVGMLVLIVSPPGDEKKCLNLTAIDAYECIGRLRDGK